VQALSKFMLCGYNLDGGIEEGKVVKKRPELAGVQQFLPRTQARSSPGPAPASSTG
jgi:hypothetical protein